MIKHTFLNKCNTIIKDSEYNTGLNPVIELNAGVVTSRILIDIDLDSLKNAVMNGEMNTSNLTHILKMKNCGSINLSNFNDETDKGSFTKKRASSFDIIAYKIPFLWDAGTGFDYSGDYAKESKKMVSKSGANWYQARNGMKWDEEGIYSKEALLQNPSLIVGFQHFDSGTEDLELDITEYINKVLDNKLEHLEEYHGICLSFTPRYEEGSAYEVINTPYGATEQNTLIVEEIPNEKVYGVSYLKLGVNYYEWNNVRDDNRFISFFSNHTNTFFHPYLETINSDVVLDDRANFHLGVNNKLYFFVNSDEGAVNLDAVPTCTIEGKNFEVKQGGKGIYYAEVMLTSSEIEPDSILTDTWSNLMLDGELLEDVEMEFVVKPLNKKISLGKHNTNTSYPLVPQISGINDKEKIKIGDTRTIQVDFIEEYSYGKKHIPPTAWYRLYVKEGDREIDVHQYTPIERRYDEHFIYVDSLELVPNTYFIDIMISQNGKAKYFENCLSFKIIDNVTKFYV